MKTTINFKTICFASVIMYSTVNAQQKIELKPSVSLPPTSYNQTSLAAGYSNPNNATSDMFGKNGAKDFSIPNNYMGSQDAVEGDNYFGIITYKGDKYIDFSAVGNGGIIEGKESENKYAEYIQVALPSNLSAGKEYEVSMKVSLADNANYATKGLGVYFSEDKKAEKNNYMLNVTPQVSFSELVTNKESWTELKSKFKATGSEKFATIGCFSSNYAVEKVGSGKGLGSLRAYYFISAITVTEAPKPDRDKDGIIDELDVCPDVAGIEKFSGCPDSDNDGVQDKDDVCPQIAGLTKFAGCPDSDNDGVADNVDKCPQVAGLVNNSGCPEVKVSNEAKEVFQKAMAGIQFETGKDIIKKTSYPILDNVATVLKENSNWNVEVQGHTDSQGDAAKNKALSEKRAIAVKNYLSNKGVTNKLTPIGYGIERPIADNKTPAGRAKNRRVEFNVTY